MRSRRLTPLPLIPTDPREQIASVGELFRRHHRANTLLETAEFVDSERRKEMAREIHILGTMTLPRLSQAAASPQENSAAMARSLMKQLVPDQVGREIYQGLQQKKRSYAVEQGAILLSRLSYPNLPTQRITQAIELMAQKVAFEICALFDLKLATFKKFATQQPLEVIKYLGEFWRSQGFHGNADSYYSERNSYLPDVLERRTGLPITLSVLYIALARRLFLQVEGVGMPGHFIVRAKVMTDAGKQYVMLDPYNGAQPLSLDDCRTRVESSGQKFIAEKHLKATAAPEIIARMCHNLLALFDYQKKALEAERIATVLVHLQPRDPVPLLIRAERSIRRGERRSARRDFENAKLLDPKGPMGRTAGELLRRMDHEYPFR